VVTKDVADELESQESRNALHQAGGSLTCQPGYVYSIGQGGEIYRIDPSGDRLEIADMGTWSTSDQFNGIGIGEHGTPVYAYHRDSRTATSIYRWNGPGTNPGKVTDFSHNLANNGYLVAGAVDLKTGAYYVGGFQNYTHETPRGQRDYAARQFRIWKHDPDADAVTYVGFANTAAAVSDDAMANGDMAFNSNGDLFFLLSDGTQATIGTITHENLQSGGNLRPSMTKSMALSGEG